MVWKFNKLDYANVKSYRVIYLFNRLGKECEKVAADMLGEWCEVNHVLYESLIAF